MKRLILFFIPFLFISCLSTKSISNDNLYEATKDVVRLENIANQLSAQNNIDKQYNAKENEILAKMPDLIDELEYSIEYEKNEKYNEGTKAGYEIGYKQALADILEKYKEEEK